MASRPTVPEGVARVYRVVELPHGVGLDHGGHSRQRLLGQAACQSRPTSALAVGQSHTVRDPIPENAMFGHQLLVSQPKFLINGACDVSARYFPAHTPLNLCVLHSYERGVTAKLWQEFTPKCK